MVHKNVLFLFLFSVLMRIFMIIYGYWQDAVMTVKFTDIDYKVFTDAANFMTQVTNTKIYVFSKSHMTKSFQGESPYNRSTYRYSPVIAGLLQMNIYIHDCIGKLIFCSCDLLIASIWWFILKDHYSPSRTNKNTTEYNSFAKLMNKSSISNEQSVEKSDTWLIFSLSLWLLNPLILTVSSRGNAEAFILLFVVLFLYFFHLADKKFSNEAKQEMASQTDKYTCRTKSKNVTPFTKLGYLYLMISGVLFGISIHLKIYPITYALVIFFNLNYTHKTKRVKGRFYLHKIFK